MRIFVTGSIAYDHLMTFPGLFSEQLLPDQLHHVSLSFLVDDLTVRRGGVAANIAYGMGVLGLRPVLAAAAGTDFAEYGQWLAATGVDVSGVLVSRHRHTARFTCTTDAAQNQLASFYPGAMSEARDISLVRLAESTGRPDLVVLSPDDPEAMMRHARECRQAGYAFAADVSQQLALLDRDRVRELVAGARYLFTNEYEHELLKQRTGWSGDEVRERVGTWVTTLGARGVRLEQGADAVEVPTPAVVEPVDPTGGGDAFRAGFLTGVARGLDQVRAAQLGCVVAGLTLAVTGPQDYVWDTSVARERLLGAYGPEAADEILGRISAGALAS